MKAFLDRNWNLLFNRNSCFQFYFREKFGYNYIVTDGRNRFRSLGNSWFKIITN